MLDTNSHTVTFILRAIEKNKAFVLVIFMKDVDKRPTKYRYQFNSLFGGSVMRGHVMGLRRIPSSEEIEFIEPSF
jgi:hypothetical protein